MELHALRLGDVAIATNTFELYTDYGVQVLVDRTVEAIKGLWPQAK